MDTNNIPIRERYNHYHQVHLIFYSFINGKLNLLLNSAKNEEIEEYKDCYTTISIMENVPTIAATRMMCSEYFGLFTNENLNKIKNKEKLEEKDLNLNHDEKYSKNKYITLLWYQLRETKSFYEWIKKMEDNPIQYDFSEGKMIYLIEIPKIDIDFFNDNLTELNYPYKFRYFEYNYEKGKNNNKEKIKDETRKLIYSFDIDKHIKTTNKEDYYIMLSCIPYHDKEYDLAGGYLQFSLFAGLYRSNNEKWLYYTAYKDQFPDIELLKSPKCKAIIIPGSSSNVYNMDPHTIKSINFIKKFMEDPECSHVKYLGICFGHQIFSEAMGGKVCRGNSEVNYIEEILVDDSFYNLEFLSGRLLNKAKSLKVYEVHIDEVVIPPDFLKVYGKSSSCDHEIFVSENGRVLTFQGHPEYTPEFLFFRTYLALQEKIGDHNHDRIQEEQLKNKRIFYSEINYELREICYCFLKY